MVSNISDNIVYRTTRSYIEGLIWINPSETSNDKMDYIHNKTFYEYNDYVYNLELSNYLCNIIRNNGCIANNIISISEMFKFFYPNMLEIIFKKDYDFETILRNSGYSPLNMLLGTHNEDRHYDISYGKYVNGKLISVINLVYVFNTEWLAGYDDTQEDIKKLDDAYIKDVQFIFNINSDYKSKDVLEDYDMICKLLNKSMVNVNDIISDTDVGNIRLVSTSYGRYVLKSHKLNMSNNKFEDLDLHYGQNFTKTYKQIMGVLNDDSHNKGVLLIHGSPGSGKSHLIKNIASSIKNKVVIFLSPDMVSNLTEPNFMSFLTAEIEKFKKIDKSVILIIEEAESILRSRDDDSYNPQIANLLNITDGLLNNIFGIQVIVTFNADIKKIDNAILRAHRAIGNIELGNLSKESIIELCKKLNLGKDAEDKFVSKRGITLADIYSYNNKYSMIEYSNNHEDLKNSIL